MSRKETQLLGIRTCLDILWRGGLFCLPGISDRHLPTFFLFKTETSCYDFCILQQGWFCLPETFGSIWRHLKNVLLYWSTVDLQCCVNFCCTAKWLEYIYIYIYIHSFSGNIWRYFWLPRLGLRSGRVGGGGGGATGIYLVGRDHVL